MDKTLVAIGWDVGGWLGKHQATAAARLATGSRTVEWLGISQPFPFEKGSVPGFTALAVPAVGADAVGALLSADRIVVAMDGPLAFPRAFRHIVSGNVEHYPVPEQEIENPLAYRDCERWVANEFGKKPLSAPFDKLGNNATLAISVASQMARERFKIVPQHGSHADRAVIEVYPAVVKTGPTKKDRAVSKLARHLPEGMNPGTDHYDAAICAVLGLVYHGAGDTLGLPDLVPFPPDGNPDEGWIFTFPGDFIQDQLCAIAHDVVIPRG